MLPPGTWIAAARGGDAQAAEALFAHLRPALQRYLSGRLPLTVRALWETDDLVQEVCSRAWRTLPSFDNDSPAAFWGYLRTIARNLSVDVCKTELARRQGTLSLDIHPEDVDRAAGDILETLERQEDYERALALLDERVRSALVLRLELGASFEEVAAELGVPSADAARKALRRALDRVLQHMEPRRPPQGPNGRS